MPDNVHIHKRLATTNRLTVKIRVTNVFGLQRRATLTLARLNPVTESVLFISSSHQPEYSINLHNKNYSLMLNGWTDIRHALYYNSATIQAKVAYC